MTSAELAADFSALARRISADPAPLVGEWTLARTVSDRHSGERGSARGGLRISKGGDGEFGWRESGHIGWAGQPARPFTRELRLVRGADGWWMRFVDGGLFHPWRIGSEVEHPCRDDIYRGRVRISAARLGEVVGLEISWLIVGPAKDQCLRTELRR